MCRLTLGHHGSWSQYVRQNITVLDSALSIFSPGVQGIDELVHKAEEAVSTSRPTMARQHVVSEGVLRCFIGPVPSIGKRLAHFDLAAGQTTLDQAKDVAFDENFVRVDSQATEDLWQTVETRLRQAIKAVRNGTVLDSPVHADILRNAAALNYPRNSQTFIVHNQSCG